MNCNVDVFFSVSPPFCVNDEEMEGRGEKSWMGRRRTEESMRYGLGRERLDGREKVDESNKGKGGKNENKGKM